MLISAMMPVFNAEDYVSLAIQSVILQTFSEWELVIVDDGSTDNTNRICQHYARLDRRIRLFTHSHGVGGPIRRAPPPVPQPASSSAQLENRHAVRTENGITR